VIDFFSNWIMGIAGASILGALTLAACPKGPVYKVLQLGIALLLSLAVLRPLANVENFNIPSIVDEYAEQEVKKIGQDLLESIIAERAEAYIVSEASAKGLAVKASIVCRQGEYYPEPYQAFVWCARPVSAKNVLASTIEQGLGIPHSRQKYLETGG